MPYIVVIVDEMSDLMLVSGKEIENYIQKLSQMARAAGIHIIMATQRPSVDVITGTIKANFPTRISFQVSSKIDSRTILGEQGAEQLLGKGDMLFMSSANRITRIHSPFVTEDEIEKVNNYLRSQAEPDYIDEILQFSNEFEDETVSDINDKDELYQSALKIVKNEGKASTSLLQRKLQIGYNRAARIIDMMEENGIVSKANHVGKREILNEKNFFFISNFFFFQNIVNATNKNDLIKKLRSIENISFNFIQTIGGKDEKGKCTIQYPKKFFANMKKEIIKF